MCNVPQQHANISHRIESSLLAAVIYAASDESDIEYQIGSKENH